MFGNSFANSIPGMPGDSPKVPVTVLLRTWGGTLMSMPVHR
jgi:hypothetical protein